MDKQKREGKKNSLISIVDLFFNGKCINKIEVVYYLKQSGLFSFTKKQIERSWDLKIENPTHSAILFL